MSVNSGSEFNRIDILVITHPCLAREFSNAFQKLREPYTKIGYTPVYKQSSLSLFSIVPLSFMAKLELKVLLQNDTSHLYANSTQLKISMKNIKLAPSQKKVTIKKVNLEKRRIICRCPTHPKSVMKKYEKCFGVLYCECGYN